jgi:hypothetical protein
MGFCLNMRVLDSIIRLSYDFLSFCAKQEPQISTLKMLICGGGWIV